MHGKGGMRNIGLPFMLSVLSLLLPAWASEAGVPLCQSAIPVPAGGSTIPANAPALGLRPGWAPSPGGSGQVDSPITTIDKVRLLDASGVPWPLMADSTGPVLMPTTFTIGAAYHLRYADACKAPAGNPAAQEASFTAGPASPLPSAVGTLVTSTNQRASVQVWGSDYVMTVDATFIDVALAMTPEMKAFAPLASFFIDTVDGLSPGSPEVSSVFQVGTTADGSPCFRVLLSCASASLTLHPDLAEGEHSVTIGARIFGSPVVPANATTRIHLSCAAPPATHNVDHKCEVTRVPAPSTNPTVPATNNTPAAIGDAGSTAPMVPATSNGCAYAAAPAGGTGFGALLFVAAALVALLCRRKSTSRL